VETARLLEVGDQERGRASGNEATSGGATPIVARSPAWLANTANAATAITPAEMAFVMRYAVTLSVPVMTWSVW